MRPRKNYVKCNVCGLRESEATTALDPFLAVMWHIKAQHPKEVAEAKAECERADAEGRLPKQYKRTSHD